jgi:Zn-dependent M28 family amino/carboxypeptidase
MTRRPSFHGPRSRLTVAVTVGLLLAACGDKTPAPTVTTAPSQTATTPAGTPGPLPSVELPGGISPTDFQAHLVALERIADANGGVRTVGTPGYDASVDYVAEQLRSWGYEAQTPAFSMPSYRELPGSTISVAGGPTFSAPDDFKAMIYSGSGDVTARVATVGFPDSAGGEGEQGCAAEDWSAFPEGAIAVTPPGHCFRRDETYLAQDAGAVALVVVYPNRQQGQPLRPTLIEPTNIRIPSLSAIGAVGDALSAAAEAGTRVTVSVETVIGTTTVRNVIAERPGSDGSRVVMLGAHLDSVHDGPGINDNGSGTAAVLEIAHLLSTTTEPATVRFAFWAGEEFGLYGSVNYVNGRSAADRSSIAAYLNLDMIGSPNGVPFVYRDEAAAPGSDAIADFLAGWLAANGEGSEFEDLGGASDHYFFEQYGIPTGGIFSGATELKTAAQASAYGGQADEPMDACYHLACDRADRVDVHHAVLYATAAASTAVLIAEGAILPAR